LDLRYPKVHSGQVLRRLFLRSSNVSISLIKANIALAWCSACSTVKSSFVLFSAFSACSAVKAFFRFVLEFHYVLQYSQEWWGREDKSCKSSWSVFRRGVG